MALPLIARGQAVGAMTVQSEEQAAFSDEDIAVLQTMADQVANAIENARLLEETQRSADRERLVGEITARMRETLDMDTVLKTAIREMGDTLGLAKIEVRLMDEIARPENGHGEGEASVY
jgi:GAF domain-containing protein